MNERNPTHDLTASLLESLRAGADAECHTLPTDIDGLKEGIELLTRVWLAETYSLDPSRDRESPGILGHFGRFEVRRLVGRGSFSAVFEAFDTTLQRIVALKIPRPDVLADASLRARFVLDAEMAANLQHPNIVPVFETNQLGPVCYTVVAFINGPNLADWMAEQDGPVEPSIAASLLRSLADAVAYAHQHGVLHRDIKPSNVLLDASTTEPSNRARHIPKLTDFGLAKEITGGEKMTQTGALIGTIAYMAPEQLAGKAQEVSARSDIYSLGIILFECLTGRRPFTGKSPSELQNLIEQSPTPSPRRAIPGLPEDLAAICSKCLEKDPRDRYVSADGLRDDLDRFLRNEPVLARPVGSFVRAYRWCRRKPLLASLTAATFIVTILGVSGIVIQWRRAERNASLIAAEQSKANAHLAQAEKTLLDLAWVAEESKLWRDAKNMYRTAVRDLVQHYHNGLVTHEEAAGIAPEVQAAALSVLATERSEAGKLDEALRHHEQCIGLWRRVVRDHPEEPQFGRAFALALYHYATFLSRRGDVDRSLESMKEGRKAFESIIPLIANDPAVLAEYAILLFELANSHLRAGNRDEARAGYETSLAAYEKLRTLEPQHHGHALRWAQVARFLGSQLRRHDPSRSFQLFESSFATLEDTLKHYPEDQTTNSQFAETCKVLGIYRLNHDIDGSIDLFHRGEKSLKLVLSKEPHNLEVTASLASLYREIATYHAKKGNADERLAALTNAGELWERVDRKIEFNSDQLMNYAMACYDEALFAERSKQVQFANQRFIQARELFERLLARKAMNSRTRHALAHCLMIAGDEQSTKGELDQAEFCYRSALRQLDVIDHRQQTPESKQRREAIEKRLAMLDTTP